MITPRVTSMQQARADFDELRAGPSTPLPFKNTLGYLKTWITNEKTLVVHVTLGQSVCKGGAEALATALNLPAGSHLILRTPEIEEGFEEAFDAWTNRELTISVEEKEQIPDEVLAVPKPEPLPAVPVTLSVDELDFEELWYTTLDLDEKSRGVLEPLRGAGDTPVAEWKYAYYTGNWSNVLLMRAFLDGHEHVYELARDKSDGDFAILTDFASQYWRHRSAQDEMRRQLELEAAEKSGDTLMRMFLAPSASKEKQR